MTKSNLVTLPKPSKRRLKTGWKTTATPNNSKEVVEFHVGYCTETLLYASGNTVAVAEGEQVILAITKSGEVRVYRQDFSLTPGEQVAADVGRRYTFWPEDFWSVEFDHVVLKPPRGENVR